MIKINVIVTLFFINNYFILSDKKIVVNENIIFDV